jgi:uncharacterized membrane protein (UPF0127 family)
MLRSAKVKIRSARSKAFIVFSLLFIVVGIVAWLGSKPEKAEESMRPPETCLQLEDKCVELEVVDTDKNRMRGLSERDSLAENQGMLFVFDQTEEQCFWMKDMHFNIDIIWLDNNKQIEKIEENASPDTYPDFFCSDNTKYVLEFNQGFAAKYGLKRGTTLQF